MPVRRPKLARLEIKVFPNSSPRCRIIAGFLALLVLALASARAQDSDASEHQREVVHRVPPVYPDLAMRLHLSGIVKLRATVGPNGSVKGVNLIGGNPVFVKAAQDAVTNWKFAPAPDETQESIELRFNEHSPHK
jgi:TonB family protein